MNYWSTLLAPAPVRRKVFISSFHDGNSQEVDQFLYRWTQQEQVFIPKALGTFHNDDFINSDNPEYVMSEIRRKYIGDASVTIVLIGRCTHSRRYVDWEIKSSLRQPQGGSPNGLLAYVLPSAMPFMGAGIPWENLGWPSLPERLSANWNYYQPQNCYARYYTMPTFAELLRQQIEWAYEDRTNRTQLIKNDSDMMKYNGKCNVCGVTH